MGCAHIPAALRRLVRDRAQGRCEYCLIPEALVLVPHEVDHLMARKHGGPTETENLALSCTLCNKHKGTDLTSIDPEDGRIVPLYHPRRDRWIEHFHLDGSSLVPSTPTARATVRLLQLNHPDRLEERELLLATGLFTVPDRIA